MIRIAQLDGLRLVAFMLVFCGHCLGLPMGHVGVDLFFVLSGFLITGILLDTRGNQHYFRDFYRSRAIRILPPYYLMLALGALVYPVNWAKVWYWYVFFLSNVYTYVEPTVIQGPAGSELVPCD